MSRPVRVILFMIVLVTVLGVMINECSVPEAKAQDKYELDYRGGTDERLLRRREVKALESIADSLKKIERKIR